MIKQLAPWFARLTVGAVFLVNVDCALALVIRPERYAPSFEVDGVAGQVLVRGMGILFLMWNATYPPVLLQPQRQRTLFAVLLAQQVIGVMGESWMLLALPPDHPVLYTSGLRFVLFDALGLLAMGLAFGLLEWTRRHSPT